MVGEGVRDSSYRAMAGDKEAGRNVRVVEVRWYAVAQQGRVING